MRAYIEIPRERLDKYKPVTLEKNSVGYIPAQHFHEYLEILHNHVAFLPEEGNYPADTYIPISSGLVIRDLNYVVSRTILDSPTRSLFAVETETYERLDFNQTMANLLSQIQDDMLKTLQMPEMDILSVMRNPLMLMGAFFYYEDFKLSEVRFVYSLLVENGSLHLMQKDKRMVAYPVNQMPAQSFDSFAQALIPQLPQISR